MQMKGWTLAGCLILVGCDSGGSGAPARDADETFVGSIAVQTELERNDDISTANPLTIASPAPGDDFVGFQVDGTIDPATDTVDTFAFTANRTRLYSMELCAFECDIPRPGASMSLTDAFFEVFDQSGTRLLTSNDHNGNVGNYREMYVDAGVLYYIQVLASDRAVSAKSYSLLAIEMPD